MEYLPWAGGRKRAFVSKMCSVFGEGSEWAPTELTSLQRRMAWESDEGGRSEANLERANFRTIYQRKIEDERKFAIV